jgi:predicted NUDIX family phosphoesterase
MFIPDLNNRYSVIYGEVMASCRIGALGLKDTVKAIAEAAYNYPVDSEEFKEGMQIIKNIDAYKGYILTCSPNDPMLPDNDITSFSYMKEFEEILSDKYSFSISTKENYKFIKRSLVEHDIRFRQVCVGALITDNVNMICLKTNDRGRIPNKYTLIQGHVDFHKSEYGMSQVDFIQSNVLRELYEEIDLITPTESGLLIGVPFTISTYPDYIINVKKTITNLEHVGFIYILRVQDCNEAFELITSKEPTKHEVVILPLEVGPNMDNWLELTINMVTNY